MAVPVCRGDATSRASGSPAVVGLDGPLRRCWDRGALAQVFAPVAGPCVHEGTSPSVTAGNGHGDGAAGLLSLRLPHAIGSVGGTMSANLPRFPATATLCQRRQQPVLHHLHSHDADDEGWHHTTPPSPIPHTSRSRFVRLDQASTTHMQAGRCLASTHGWIDDAFASSGCFHVARMKTAAPEPGGSFYA